MQYGFDGSGNPQGTLVATPFATETVYTNSECGLIGMCFDPDFVNNGYLYLFITVSSSEQQIVRYNASTNTGTGRTVLRSGLPTAGNNHDGGTVLIGPDGKLYWAIGDNGNGTGVNADLTSLASKIGRADRFTGAPPNDNPFYDGGGPNNDYIWARGFRNPFTGLFHPGSGTLWMNTVGTSYEQVFVPIKGDHAGYNTYENNQPAGYITPRIVYRTNGSDVRNLAASPSGAVRSGGVTTFTTTGAHGFRKGGGITIAGVGDGSFNGFFFIQSIPSTTTFTVAQVGQANATSGGGTATTQNIGGAISGGYFYDSTAFPAEYHLNYFFGDYNSGRLQRVILDSSEQVISVNDWLTANNQQVDVCTGPDGALYLASVTNNQIVRVATTSTAQNVIVHPTTFHMTEGGVAVFTIRLAAPPASNVVVGIAPSGGSTDITVAGPATRTFTPANWNITQTVALHADQDADFVNDVATFSVSSTGLPSYTVQATAIDDDEANLILSTQNLTVVEGTSTSFTVRLIQAPVASQTVNSARLSGSTDVTVTGGAALVFGPGNYAVDQTVTISAAEDADQLNEAAVISVGISGQPVRTLSVNLIDNDNPAPSITTSPKLAAIEDSPYAYDVDALGTPVPTFSLITAPSGMTINPSSGLISWTPATTGNFNVTVQAANGVSPAAIQNFTILVGPDQPPVAALTRPVANEVVTGAAAEFFGDGTDDVGTTKAEFYVDGALIYTDTNPGGHYHAGGSHLLFDSTKFTNGPHTFGMKVTDTSGQTNLVEVGGFTENGFLGWKVGAFTAAERLDPLISGETADPDGDGMWNLMEYGTGSQPKLSDLSRLPKVKTVNAGGSDYLALEIVIIEEPSDLAFKVLADGDLLGIWTEIDPTNPANQFSIQADTPAVGLSTITVRDVVPIGSGPRFMRLNIQR